MMYTDIEMEYTMIGLLAFFETEDDKNMDWEEYFGSLSDSLS